MKLKGSGLCLGTRQDAETWRKGCTAAGVDVGTFVRKATPTMGELEAFFGSEPDWVYLGGHFGSKTLFNEHATLQLRFSEDRVDVIKDRKVETSFVKGSGFMLHKTAVVVLWGGCDVCGVNTLKTLRQLFDGHVLLGFSGSTGASIVDAMLGNGFMKRKHFFAQLGSQAEDLVAVRNAWMGAAKAGYGGTGMEDRFHAIDYEGQGWKLLDGEIKRWISV